MTEIIVPETWRDRLASSLGRRRESWVVVGLVAAVVLGALVLWQRGAPARIAPPATAPAAPAAIGQPATPATGAQSEVVLVHVAGAVRRPGLYELHAGARVADAIEAARGPLRRGDLDQLNLAESLSDGQKVEVPLQGRSAAAPPVTAPSPTPSVAVVDINVADQAALESIPGIGPVTATAILDYRGQIGSFTSVDQLLEVSGIGPVTLEDIRPYVTV
jgi:competence protein ComEA